MKTSKSTLPLAALSLILLSAVSAEIKDIKFVSDARPMILLEKFGFTRTGRASISASSVSVTSAASMPIPSRFGFFLLPDVSIFQVLTELNQNPNLCVLDSRYITLLFTFRDLSPPPHSDFNHSYAVTFPDEYSLFFANCHPESKVSMFVHTELYNLDHGSSKDYLSVGLTALPTIFLMLSLCYFGFFVVWSYVCFTNKEFVQRIHLLMAELLLVKALNQLGAAGDKNFVRITGTPHGWNVLFYIFQFYSGVFLFTIIVLIGTGWSFFKSFLEEREKKVLMIVIPLQFIANLLLVVMGETGPFVKNWVAWNQIFLLVDIICCCAIIFPIVWSIKSLREASKTDGKAGTNLTKLKLIRQFYITVIVYLFFTRIVAFGLKTMISYKYQWAANGAEELASLVFFIVIFYMFKPAEKNYYDVLDEEKEASKVPLLKNKFVHV